MYAPGSHGLGLSSPSDGTALPYLTAGIDRGKVFEIYASRVDTIIKVFHFPSMREQLRARSTVSPELQTLEGAMYLLAICTLQEHECTEQLRTDKSLLICEYKANVEAKLLALEWLVNNELHLMQALVIYVVNRPPSHVFGISV